MCFSLVVLDGYADFYANNTNSFNDNDVQF